MIIHDDFVENTVDIRERIRRVTNRAEICLDCMEGGDFGDWTRQESRRESDSDMEAG